MLPIDKQVKRDFQWVLKQKETPKVTITWDTRVGGSVNKFYGNEVGGTLIPHSLEVKCIIENVDEWKVKKLPYLNLHVGQAIFYIDKKYDFANAENIKVTWNDYIWAISSVENAIPLGTDYLCKVLISAE